MPRRRRYVLTPTARDQLREAKAWSLARWGPKLTAEYFQDLHDAAQQLAISYRTHRSRAELTGGTGLLIFPVREHYLVYEPLADGRIAIVAVIRQSRDIPNILAKGKHAIDRELKALRETLSKRTDQQS